MLRYCTRHKRVLKSLERGLLGSTTSSHLGLSHRQFNVLFFGRDSFSSQVFAELSQAKDILDSLVVATTQDQWVGRRRQTLSIAPLKLFAQSLDVPVVHIPEDKEEFSNWVPPPPFQVSSSDNVLVTASFGRRIPQSCLGIFDRGRKLNVHPSLLPAYRGAAPIQHALLDGIDATGVSVIEMEDGKGFDFGDIWAQEDFKIPDASTYLSLEPELARLGGRLLVHVLHQAKTNPAFAASPQDHTRATKARLIKAEQSEIQWSTWDAARVERTHRAIGHQRPVFTTLPDRVKSRLQLLEMRVACEDIQRPALVHPGDASYEPSDNTLRIRCANRTQLAVSTLKSENKNALKIKEWWNGVPPQWLNGGVLKLGPDV
ncbi:Methionyl-tRNA formyltransferase [Ceratobasidium sp. UAMH 11750]|nr:Methionyl-tRNA formyltransferase [Ceratobasidium sp. UAMH 11750]